MATNNTFYRKTKNFVIKSLEVLEEIKGSEGIPLNPIEEEIATIDEHGGVAFKPVQKPAYSYFIFNNREKIKELPEYEECKKCMYEDKTINKHLGKLVDVGRIEIDTCLHWLILEILKSGSLKFNEKIFKESFEKLVKFFTSDKLHFCTFTLLECFRTDVDEIQLDTNLRISKISSHKELWERFKSSVPLNTILSVKFGIEREYETDKFKPPSDTPAQETDEKRIFDEVISALRLFKPGTVGYNFIRTETSDWNPIGISSISYGIFKHPYHGEYHLEKDELLDFKEFFKKLENKPNFLDIPIRYFNYAYTRERPEDKLIDYMIAFEGLFVKEKAELSYRLSLRVAAFLGENRDEKGKIFTLMRRTYDLRSDIVHGSSYSKNIEINEEKLSFGELVSRVEELLRKSIKKSIETGQKPDRILENSPESIFFSRDKKK